MTRPDEAARMAQNFDDAGEADLIDAFLTECCEVTGFETDFTTAKDLVEAFAFWLDERGQAEWRSRTIAVRIKERSKSFRDPRSDRTFRAFRGATPRHHGIRDVAASPAGYLGIRLTYPFLLRFRGGSQADPIILYCEAVSKQQAKADVTRSTANLGFQVADAARRFPPLNPGALFCVFVFLGMAIFVGLIAAALAS